jgi:hypothetical protein
VVVSLALHSEHKCLKTTFNKIITKLFRTATSCALYQSFTVHTRSAFACKNIIEYTSRVIPVVQYYCIILSSHKNELIRIKIKSSKQANKQTSKQANKQTATQHTNIMQIITGNNRNNTTMVSFLSKDYTPQNTDDILCGRGNVYSSRPGNQYFQRIIQDNRHNYQEASTRPAKIKVVDNILKEIHTRGVRFTKMSNNNKRWCELDNVAAHQKIGHAIRDTIRLHEKENNYSNKSSNSSSRCNKSSVAIKKQKIMKKIHETKRNNRREVVRTSLNRQRKNQWLSSGEDNDNNSTITMDEIFSKSLETVDFLDDVFGNNENNENNNFPSSSYEVEQQLKQQQEQFLLTNEYPDTHFDFIASAFFGGDEKEENDDVDDEHTSSTSSSGMMFYEHDNAGDYSYTFANEEISLNSQLK